MEKKKKVFVFGIDGTPPKFVFGEWLDELPTIKKLMQKGCYAKLNSTIPPLTGVAWTSMTTGKRPSNHGVFEYVYRKNHSYYDYKIITSNNIKAKTIWQILSEHNKKSIISFIPLTWPVKPLNGCLISGPLTPLGEEAEFAYPPKLKQEINSFLGEPLLIDVPDFRNLSKQEVIKEIYKISEMHIKTMKYLLKNKKWDIFFGLISGSDRMNHTFWRYADKSHRKYNPNSEFKNVLKDYYKFIDRELGKIINNLEKDVTIIVLSDHGMSRMDNRVNLTDWLIDEGYMVLKEPIKEKTKFNPMMVDWSKTRVFAIGAYEGQIFVNLKGREPEGIVLLEEYDKLIDELEERLKKIPGDDGKILDTKIFKKKDYFKGKYEYIAPDMIIYFDNLIYGCNNSLIGNETLWSPQTAMGSDEAGHSPKGIFIMNDSIKNENIGEVDILDVAPTILNKLNITIPEDMEGKIIE